MRSAQAAALAAAVVFAAVACKGREAAGPGGEGGPPAQEGGTEARAPAGEASRTGEWGFDQDAEGGQPSDFTFGLTGSGRPGKWVVQAAADAPSAPHVLAQLDADDTDFRFPVAVADAPVLRDLRLTVNCKAVSGHVDQAVGLVWRYRSEGDYYVARANALEGNVRIYHIKDGKRRQFGSWSGAVTAGAWHRFAVEARGDHFQVFWDGEKVLDAHDATFPDAGRVGLWTKADSVSLFDDLTAEALD